MALFAGVYLGLGIVAALAANSVKLGDVVKDRSGRAKI
jgi:hypothetical protein